MDKHNQEEVYFLDLVEESLGELDALLEGNEEEPLEEEELHEDEELDDYCLLGLDESELSELQEELGIDSEEMEEILEAVVRRVNARGQITRVKDRHTRKRKATQTTGLTKTQRKLRARKAARTKKRTPGKLRKAVKRRNRAMQKRKSMSIK